MFTGLVEAVGQLVERKPTAGGSRLRIATSLAGELAPGDSVAVNGVCLTVVENREGRLAFDAVLETLDRTSLGALKEGARVNLERPLRAGGRLDGHIVQGHVDGTAALESVTPEGNGYRLRYRPAPELLRYIVEKGSICIDGISLTVAALGPDWFEVAIIPHTWEITNLRERQPGDRANIEVDVLAKYVERLLGFAREAQS